MDIYSGHINKLIEQLSRLPGVGAKSAQRLAFHIINMPKEEVEGIANAMISAKEHIHYCKECYTLTDEELCPICKDPNRITSRLWSLNRQGIWQHTKRQESMRACIMYFTGL